MPNRALLITTLMTGCLATPAWAEDIKEAAQAPAEATDKHEHQHEQPVQPKAKLAEEPGKPTADKAEEKPTEKTAETGEEKTPEKATDKAGGEAEPLTAKEAEDEEKKSEQQALREKLNQLERELRETRSEFKRKAEEGENNKEKDHLQAIDAITLPENPTREQCVQYMDQLREATKNRRSFSSRDPVVDKLKALPKEHYDLIMTEVTNNSAMLRIYANYALRDIDPEIVRDRFVASVSDNPASIGIIVSNGWVNDIRESVIATMRTADGSLSREWFQAAVELDEPELYPKLHEVAINSRYAGEFIEMLKMLPDYDLDQTVNVCWERAKSGKLSVSKSTIAPFAVERGNVEALGELIARLGSYTSYYYSSSSRNSRRAIVLRHIDFRGSNTELEAWYKQNKDELVFDPLRKRFTIPEDF